MKVELEIFKASEKLPEESGEVLVWARNSNLVVSTNYSEEHNKFNCRNHYTKEEALEMAMDVEFWAYLPEVEK